jgi:hypothetical protein
MEYIIISLYDTTLPDIPINTVFDYAEKNSINLIYEGADDKFSPFMASRLDFSLEVPISESLNVLQYDYLFTGNETKFKIIVKDNFNNIVWQGFLLPEAFNEPYVTGTYYLKLTATDGIGRLKGYIFIKKWYNVRHSVSKIIADCLKFTGLLLPLKIMSSVVMFETSSRWDSIFLLALKWKNENDYADVYTILEAVLIELRLTLHQEKGSWYLNGVNKKGANPIYDHYDVDGVFLGTFPIFDLPKYLLWYGAPQITIKAPFREVVTTTSADEIQNVFVDDVVLQDWNKIQQPQQPPPPNYWIGSDSQIIPVLLQPNGDPFNEFTGDDLIETGVIGFRQILDASLFDHWVTLARDIYVKADLEMDFKVVFIWRVFDPNQTYDWETYVDSNCRYKITINGNIAISNIEGFAERNTFLFKQDFKYSGDYSVSTCTVIAKGFTLPESGFLNFVLFHGGSSVSVPDVTVQIDELYLNYLADFQSVFSKRRNINFTTTTELTIFNCDSVFNDQIDSFYFQPLFDISDFTEIDMISVIEKSTSFIYINVVRVSQEVWDLMQIKYLQLYVKRDLSDFYEWCDDVRFYQSGLLYLVKFNFIDGYKITPSDQMYFSENIGNPQTPEMVNKREKWTLTTNGPIAPVRLGFAIDRAMHNSYSEALIVMSGFVKGVIFPNTLLNFELKGSLRRFIVLRSEIMININESNVMLIEYKDFKVNDYE